MQTLSFFSILLLILSSTASQDSNPPLLRSVPHKSQKSSLNNDPLLAQETTTTDDATSTTIYEDLSLMSFVGTWTSTGSKALYNTFKNNGGKIMFNFNEGLKKKNRLIWYEESDPSSTLNQAQILLIDGEYFDDPLAFIFFEAIAKEYIDTTSNIIDLTIPTTTIDSLKNCDISLKIDFSNMISAESTINDSGSITIAMRSSACPLNFDAIVYRDLTDTPSKLLWTSIFLGIVFLIIFLSNLKLIFSFYKYQPDTTYLSPYLPVSLAIFDLIYLLNIHTITNFTTFDAPLIIMCLICVLFLFSSVLLLAVPLMRNTQNLKEDITVGEFLRLPLLYGFPPALAMLALFISSEHIFVHPVFMFFTVLFPAVQILEYINEGGPAPFYFKTMGCVFTLRILLPLYLKGYSDNLYQIKTSIPLCIAIIAVFVFQVLVLYLQARRGSRFFLPNSLFPPEDSQPLKRNMNQGTELIRLENKCQLCQKGLLEHPNIERTPNPRIRQALVKRRLREEKIVMTECHHRFHAICLVDRTFSDPTCPICEFSLKPLD